MISANRLFWSILYSFRFFKVGVLSESSDRSRRPAAADYILRAKKQKFDEDIAYLSKVSMDLVQKRRENPTDKKDLLNAMLNSKDPKLGQGLTDDSIVDNMITFLVAGMSKQPF